MTLKRSVIFMLLLYLCITIVLLIVDQLLIGGALMQDFLSVFVHEDMQPEYVILLLGEPQRDIGSGLSVLEWDMLYDAHFRVSCHETEIFSFAYEANNGSVQGITLPLCLVLIGFIEAAAYFTIKRFRPVHTPQSK